MKFKCLFNKNKKSFSILSNKAQSINAKIDQLRIFIDRLKSLGHELSAICNQKSWLTCECDTSQLQLHGYQMIPQGRITFLVCSIGWCVLEYAVLHHSLSVLYWMVCFSICCLAPLTYCVVLDGVFQHMLFCTTHLLFCTYCVVQDVVSHGMSCHMLCNVFLCQVMSDITCYVTYDMICHMTCHATCHAICHVTYHVTCHVTSHVM